MSKQPITPQYIDLMPYAFERWAILEGIDPPAFPIAGMRPELAKARFLTRYRELRGAA